MKQSTASKNEAKVDDNPISTVQKGDDRLLENKTSIVSFSLRLKAGIPDGRFTSTDVKRLKTQTSQKKK